MPEPMLTMRPQDSNEGADPTEADRALLMGEAVASVFEEHGGVLNGLNRQALARDLAETLHPLLSTCTKAEWIEAINARLDRLEGEIDRPGPRLERFGPTGAAEMTKAAH